MIGQGAPNCPNCESNLQCRRRPIAAMYAFEDEVLLNIFHHCRPSFSNEHEAGNNSDDHNLEERQWDNERWWYKLVHVCRKWRRLIFKSASHLRIRLLCTYGTPIEAMLTSSPALPIIIDYGEEDREVTAQDEDGILFALRRCRHRVGRIRLWMPAQSLRRLLAVMNCEFQMLENLYVRPLTDDNSLALPTSFDAPHLCHFVLRNIFRPLWMFRPSPPIPHIPSTERFGEFAEYHASSLQSSRSLKMFLNDDSLLKVFQFCRPSVVFEDYWHSGDPRFLKGRGERWWYKLAHVCRRWRYLILASASHLNLCLVCIPGTPVADMLTNSPPLPLIIGHFDHDASITAEDKEGVMLALQHRDRVRHICLKMPLLDLQKLVLAIDEEFPTLEFLYIHPSTKCNSWLTLPNTFQAPRLRRLDLEEFVIPIRSPLITTNTSLVTFILGSTHQSAYRHPNDLLEQISLMPQLETLWVTFDSPVPNRDVDMQLMHKPVTTHVTLPNLRQLGLKAASAYMDALLPRMTTPLLELFRVNFFFQPNYSVPHLLEFISAAQNLRFGSATCSFDKGVIFILVYPHDDTREYSFATDIRCQHLDWQVSFATQIFLSLRTVFTAVKHLSLEFTDDFEGTNNDISPTQWRELLGLFCNVTILRINDFLLREIPHCFQVDDGGSPLELLPELKELHYPFDYDLNAFSTFIDARQKAGRPLTLVTVPH